jgi:hypothetical protein
MLFVLATLKTQQKAVIKITFNLMVNTLDVIYRVLENSIIQGPDPSSPQPARQCEGCKKKETAPEWLSEALNTGDGVYRP